MKKSWLYVGVGVLITALVSFLLRLIEWKFLQDNVTLMIILLVVSIIFIVVGLVGKGG